MRKILIVGDREGSRLDAERILSAEFEVITARGTRGCVELVREHEPDVVLLDVQIPGLDGIEACRSIRSDSLARGTGVIMMSADPSEGSRVHAFRAGADDYIVKPVTGPELIARVRSKLPRVDEGARALHTAKPVSCGNLRLHPDLMSAVVEGNQIPLSAIELSLLQQLIGVRPRILTRKEILETIWKGTTVSERTIDTHIYVLRKKLSCFDHEIGTVYGSGYSLKPRGRLAGSAIVAAKADQMAVFRA